MKTKQEERGWVGEMEEPFSLHLKMCFLPDQKELSLSGPLFSKLCALQGQEIKKNISMWWTRADKSKVQRRI